MMTLSFERPDTRITDSDYSNSVHLRPGIPEESKRVAGAKPPATGFDPFFSTIAVGQLLLAKQNAAASVVA
jgi:hypothetical protein